jgi:glyoxylase-like metal-dependent hydrolase (beta-lactamase superfamily II)
LIRRATFLVLALVVTASTRSAAQVEDADVAEGAPISLGADLILREVAPGVWVHVAVKAGPEGRPLPANGLVVVTESLSVLVDTGWDRDQARRLIGWSSDVLKRPVRHVIVTHAHPDRIGGLEAVRDLPILVHGHAFTARLARLYGMPPFHWTFDRAERLNLGGETFDLLYPGPGHAHDNIVVYLPRRRLLFAGCLVRSAGSRDLGPLDDANLKTWPIALRRVIETYRDTAVLVPGHGAPGGVALLSHTMELLEEETRRRSQTVE